MLSCSASYRFFSSSLAIKAEPALAPGALDDDTFLLPPASELDSDDIEEAAADAALVAGVERPLLAEAP